MLYYFCLFFFRFLLSLFCALFLSSDFDCIFKEKEIHFDDVLRFVPFICFDCIKSFIHFRFLTTWNLIKSTTTKRAASTATCNEIRHQRLTKRCEEELIIRSVAIDDVTVGVSGQKVPECWSYFGCVIENVYIRTRRSNGFSQGLGPSDVFYASEKYFKVFSIGVGKGILTLFRPSVIPNSCCTIVHWWRSWVEWGFWNLFVWVVQIFGTYGSR